MTAFKSTLPRSLASNLAFWFCLVSVALTLVLVGVIDLWSSTKVREQIGLKLAGLAFQTTDKLDQGMFERYREVQLMSMRPTFGDPAVPTEEKRRLLDQMQETYALYSWIGVTDIRGRVLAATGGTLEGADVSKRPWWSNALRAIHVGDVHDAKLLASKLPNPSGDPMRFVDVAFPYVDKAGDVSGVIGAHMSWKWAEEVERSVITPVDARRGIEAFIISDDGTVLLGPNGMVGARLLSSTVTAARAGRNAYAVEQWPDGREYLVGYSRSRGFRNYPGLGWSVLVRQEASEAFAPVNMLQKQVLWSGLGVALLFSVLGLFNARRITRPLKSLAEAARRLRLGQARTLEGVPASYGEVDELAASMSSLVDDLQHNQAALEELNASLEQRVEERTAQLASSESRLRMITDSIPALIAYVDAEQRYRFCNRTYEEWFRRGRESIVGATLAEVLDEAAYATAAPYVERALRGETVSYERSLALRSGLRHLRVQYIPNRTDSGVTGFYVLTHDITDSKNYEMALQHDLLTDALTGLPNRTAYLQQLNAALARARRSRKAFGVMFLDVDKFKSINDNYGHEVGDEVLIEFGRRLRAAVRETDTVARLAGDEFVVLAENLTEAEADAQLVAKNILDAVRAPLSSKQGVLNISTSIGIALCTDAAETGDVLIKKADSAMYDAKRAGRNQVVLYSGDSALAA